MIGCAVASVPAPNHDRVFMSNALTVPASLEEIVQRFDAREEPFDEFTIGGELKQHGVRSSILPRRQFSARGPKCSHSLSRATGTKIHGTLISARWALV
jgi:hypothetical protein